MAGSRAITATIADLTAVIGIIIPILDNIDIPAQSLTLVLG